VIDKWTHLRQGHPDERFERIVGPFLCSVSHSGVWTVQIVSFFQPIKSSMAKNSDDGKRDAISFVTKQLFDMCDELDLERPTAKIDTTAFMF
jgi:hypothetical protein